MRLALLAAIVAAFLAGPAFQSTAGQPKPDPAPRPIRKCLASAHCWSQGYWYERRWRQNLQNQLRKRHRPSMTGIITVAAKAYGQNPTTLLRKAECETGGTFSPYAYNRSSGASGLFQFLGGTWRSTPFGRFNMFDPFANALAASWMHSHGRSGEWACR